jgi:hypothetical protein
VQKRQRSQVMADEVSESFDPARHAAIEKNIKAEKVRVGRVRVGRVRERRVWDIA